jgi:hypothetical protein
MYYFPEIDVSFLLHEPSYFIFRTAVSFMSSYHLDFVIEETVAHS